MTTRPPAHPAPARGVRTTGGVAAAVLAGVGAHVAAGGMFSLPGALVAAALLAAPVWSLTGREHRWPAITLLLGCGQLLVHGVLELASAPMTHLPGDGLLPSGPMLLCHLAGAAVLGGWLRLGEHRLWQAARHAVNVLAGLLRLLALTANPPRHDAAHVCPLWTNDGLRPPGEVLRHVMGSRAPPALRAF